MNGDAVLTNLLVIQRVGINDKLVFDGAAFNIRPNTSFRAFARWWYSENRYSNYEALRSVICAGVNLVELHMLRNEVESANRIKTALLASQKGLRNLSETYRDDVDMTSRLSMLITDLEAFLQTGRTIANTYPSSIVSPVPSPTNERATACPDFTFEPDTSAEKSGSLANDAY